MNLENYVLGKWIAGDGDGKQLYDATSGDVVAVASSKGLDFADILKYGREVGNPVLRKMTFQERGRMLKALALHLMTIKDKFYELSYATGATKADSWVDIEGGIGNLFAYSSLRRQFPDESFYVDGEAVPLSKTGSFIGHHIMVPKEGVAIHINAYNFPIWGMLEKIAVNLLAGMPAVVKPATVTSFLTELMVREIVKSGILPEGSLQLICGSAHGILDHAQSQDVVTFTGSATTGRMLKSTPQILQEAVPFNMEADSLNSSILGPDVEPGSPEFDLFIKEVQREMTTKCGQKCTAIRRVIVPKDILEDVQIALANRLAKTTVGDPRLEGVRMGALAGKTQLKEVREKVNELLNSSSLVYGDLENVTAEGNTKNGAFMSPIILRNDDPFKNLGSHEIEAFGPVSTIMPYDTLDDAIALSKMGKGSLVCSIATYNDKDAKEFVLGAASHHGRILVLNRDCARESTGHGSPMPMLVHGGPGRAGGGEEMGGKRGVMHYMQRTSIQGSPTTLSAITNVYQNGGKQTEGDIHPFRKYFENLKIGDTEITAKHTVTEADITNFANVSGDNFYAHVDGTSLEGTIFEQRVAHGYFVLSKAAGLFVSPKKGPVLLNYGIEECRFTKPVYPGMTIGVKLTVKQKIEQEKRDEEDIAKGIVKFLVDVYDETGETVAIATILTMVKKENQEGS
ncbi:phenylacetic acid degradation bifunctional protein PaaZ [Cryomorpha ignava]|uniref:Phenylacetic acid degradation bifunctional protein PaaZ n=1 Tax=Cryomorpha ignava TaxID=101383 RepID=A0A7K3WV29_9FLAO|nr:phenylacetic acid degradation bifunctional protein PaaZ [Cryomorpha ignava]NEN24772.1 phenylacetic acid degradation bifunctional protein PaaZ [Cryomorpha ignava]